MINYQYQHDAHVLDWRMIMWMTATPLPRIVPRTDEDIEFERNWSNFQSQLYYGWRQNNA